MTTDTPVCPPYDPELASSLSAAPPRQMDFDPRSMAGFQEEIVAFGNSLRAELEGEGLLVEDLHAPASDGYAIPLHHVRRPDARPGHPCIYYIHGGGMVLGSPWDSVFDFARWIADFDLSVVTVDYRLGLDVKAPVIVEDCYAGLMYVHKQAAQLGIDPESIVVGGMSGGGGLAAGTALLARDRGEPPMIGQLLLAPMLDPDCDDDSTRQLPEGPWRPEDNRRAWGMILDGVSDEEAGHNAPARAATLAGLPPALLEVGSAEMFRCQVVAYAERIWREGGNAELHVWSGGFHGFQGFAHAAVTQAAFESRRNWLRRLFGYGPHQGGSE